MGADNAAEQVIARMIARGQWPYDPERPWVGPTPQDRPGGAR